MSSAVAGTRSTSVESFDGLAVLVATSLTTSRRVVEFGLATLCGDATGAVDGL
jgi:hypothetical protein